MLLIVDFTEELVDEARDMKLSKGNSLSFSIELLGVMNEFSFVDGANIAETTTDKNMFTAEFVDGEKVEINLLRDDTVTVKLTRTTGDIITEYDVMTSDDVLLIVNDKEVESA